jgi:hypothetical protein
MSVQFSWADNEGSNSIEIVNEGGGYFAILKAETGYRVDPDEFLTLAKWVKETCDYMDKEVSGKWSEPA